MILFLNNYTVINNRVPVSFFTFAENTVCTETQQPEENKSLKL